MGPLGCSFGTPGGLLGAPWGLSEVSCRQITKHEYSLANTRMPKTSQEAPELLRGTPCGPNCNVVWRFGASKVLKSTATTNTATEKRQIAKHNYIGFGFLPVDGDRRPKGGGPLRSTTSSSRTTSEVVGRNQRSNGLQNDLWGGGSKCPAALCRRPLAGS